MDTETSISSSLFSFVRHNFLVLTLFLIGLILLSIGLMQMFGSKEADIKFQKGSEVAGASSSKIKVDVEGEVIKPGLYEVSSDARVQDALIAAGGLSPNADRNAVNLAAKVSDGQKIYVPAKGQTTSEANPHTSSSVISINRASQKELETLPSIGAVTAQKIISNRPYGLLEELISKKAVGQKTYDKLKDLISL